VRELWSGSSLEIRDGVLDLGAIAPHGCRVAVLATDAAWRARSVDSPPALV
jgi:hypothetical protein